MLILFPDDGIFVDGSGLGKELRTTLVVSGTGSLQILIKKFIT